MRTNPSVDLKTLEIAHLRSSGQPELIVVRGKPSCWVVLAEGVFQETGVVGGVPGRAARSGTCRSLLLLAQTEKEIFWYWITNWGFGYKCKHDSRDNEVEKEKRGIP